jgi:uncharacterized protein
MNITTKKNNETIRRCIATGESLPKQELLRIVKTPEGMIVIDPTGKRNGRGAYIKKMRSVLPILKKTNALKKALKTDIPQTFYEELIPYLDE